MSDSLRLVHFADCHLGYKAYARMLQGRNQREIDVALAFTSALNKTIDLKPDVVLIAGDFFHVPRPSNQSILYAYKEMQRLVASLPDVEIVIIAGEHDLPSMTDNVCLLPIFKQLSSRIHVATDHVARFGLRGGELAVLCVPQKIFPRPFLEPFAQSKFNVLLMHGEIEGVIDRGARELPEHRVKETEISDTGWNYIALGHYHTYREVLKLPQAYYSGSLDYASSDVWRDARSGISKGIVEHDLASGAHTFHEIELARHVIDLPRFNAQGMTSAEVSARIKEIVESVSIDDQIVRLVIDDIPKPVIRDLDHKMIREFKRRALHFTLDERRPDEAQLARGELPRRRLPLREVVRSELMKRELTPGIDRGELVALAMHYLDLADEKEALKGASLLASQSTEGGI